MARSSIIAGAKENDGLMMIRGAGIMGLGLSILLEALVVTPFCPNPRLMIAPFFLAALVQIGAGLHEWRQDRTLLSVILVSFGLFTCAQISQLGSVPATSANSLAQGAFLLFWGIFALLLAAQPSAYGRTFPLMLAATATTLFIKALILAFAGSLLWTLPLLAGVISLSLAILTLFHSLPALRS